MCVSVTTAHVTSRPGHNQDRHFLVLCGIFLFLPPTPLSLPPLLGLSLSHQPGIGMTGQRVDWSNAFNYPAAQAAPQRPTASEGRPGGGCGRMKDTIFEPQVLQNSANNKRFARVTSKPNS